MTDYDRQGDIYSRWSIKETLYSVLEWHTFLQVLGSVKGLDILDVACGDGRLSRGLMDHGAKSVLGTDISENMIAAANEKNRPDAESHHDGLHYQTVDARDEAFRLETPVDLVTAMYLFHYATSVDDLDRMCRFVSRNLRPGGRFVCYTINPEYDFERQYPLMADAFGFRYKTVDPPEYRLVIGDFEAKMWQWSKAEHEGGLKKAGLTNIRWHALALPENRKDLAPSVQWYLDNPSLIVLSAEKSTG
ncbi:class I SAM-dependent methyltransferase [Hoeflea sp. TYP-13]|uniref:class I SAM-dependent methyltransferase n=1 Tax=Hoeflea sp. TYP-13 TaxID=3230023 RepID=UPI0034C5C033